MNVGCLGSGQLALMLAEAASRLKIKFRVLASKNNDPACPHAESVVVGSVNDSEALKKFSQGLDVVSFESEFLPYDLLRTANLPFVPPISLIEALSDKIEQKKLAQAAGVKVSDFNVFEGSADRLKSWMLHVIEVLRGEVVFKWARGGYDGKGVHIFSGDEIAALEFLNIGLANKSRVFAEKKIAFRRELSQISVRSTKGEMAFYPPVFSEQKNGICRVAYGPATSFGLAQITADEMVASATRFAHTIGLVGTFALELFECADGSLLLNEVAPRVHNTGHFTLDASETNQFENHLRAITGMNLGDTNTGENFFMLNLLGQKNQPALAPGQHPPRNGVLKWYDKAESRLGRKMGHINWFGFKASELEGLRRQAEEWETSWQS